MRLLLHNLGLSPEAYGLPPDSSSQPSQPEEDEAQDVEADKVPKKKGQKKFDKKTVPKTNERKLYVEALMDMSNLKGPIFQTEKVIR